MRTIIFPEVVDTRGRLLFAEQGEHIPFVVKRIFAIYDVPDDQNRACHAHRVQSQLIFMLAGSCKVIIEAGTEKCEKLLNNPRHGLYVPPLVWIELKEFAPMAVCLVLASDHYDSNEYIYDYEEFRRLHATA